MLDLNSPAIIDLMRRLVPQIEQVIVFQTMTEKNAFFKRIRSEVPPYPRRPGRPRKELISKAYELYQQQRREYPDQNVKWQHIALECIPGYAKMNPHRRMHELRKLQSAVLQREKQKPPKMFIVPTNHTGL